MKLPWSEAANVAGGSDRGAREWVKIECYEEVSQLGYPALGGYDADFAPERKVVDPLDAVFLPLQLLP